MSDLNRTPLFDEDVEDITGGSIQYVNDSTGKYLWSSFEPDVQYGFADKSALKAFVAENYQRLGESATIAGLLSAGIIWPL